MLLLLNLHFLKYILESRDLFLWSDLFSYFFLFLSLYFFFCCLLSFELLSNLSFQLNLWRSIEQRHTQRQTFICTFCIVGLFVVKYCYFRIDWHSEKMYTIVSMCAKCLPFVFGMGGKGRWGGMSIFALTNFIMQCKLVTKF